MIYLPNSYTLSSPFITTLRILTESYKQQVNVLRRYMTSIMKRIQEEVCTAILWWWLTSYCSRWYLSKNLFSFHYKMLWKWTTIAVLTYITLHKQKKAIVVNKLYLSYMYMILYDISATIPGMYKTLMVLWYHNINSQNINSLLRVP